MSYTFISGATGGIGRAFVYACAKKRYNMFITARSQDKLSELASRVSRDFGVDIVYFACDLTSEYSRADMVRFIDKKGLKFNRIINVAGVDIQKPFEDFTQDKVRMQVRVNSEATVCLTHELISRAVDGEKGEIITIASMSGASPMPYFALYSATKAMLISFFTSLHYELKGRFNVTVVMPGGVPTRPDIIEDIKKQGLWGKLSAKSPSYVAEKSLKAVKKNKTKYIPGFFNRFLYFVMKLAPKRWVLRFIVRRWSKISKDSF